MKELLDIVKPYAWYAIIGAGVGVLGYVIYAEFLV